MPRRNHRRGSTRSPRWALWRWLAIPDQRNPDEIYLLRLRVVQTPWFYLYIHWIYLPDGQDPHDHPWNFWSFVVRGGYTEWFVPRPGQVGNTGHKRVWSAGSVHSLKRPDAHNITYVKPGTVTVVWGGKRQGTWGFYTPEGWIEWMNYEVAKV